MGQGTSQTVASRSLPLQDESRFYTFIDRLPMLDTSRRKSNRNSKQQQQANPQQENGAHPKKKSKIAVVLF